MLDFVKAGCILGNFQFTSRQNIFLAFKIGLNNSNVKKFKNLQIFRRFFDFET